MKTTALKLQIYFYATFLISLLLVVLGETDVFPTGILSDNAEWEFYMLIVLELVSLCAIPLALWMFRAKRIKQALTEGRELALGRYGFIRYMLLAIPFLGNIICYYLFMHASFGYMAIIIFLSMLFVFPSLDRCMTEVSEHL